jgi:hypothetical protein
MSFSFEWFSLTPCPIPLGEGEWSADGLKHWKAELAQNPMRECEINLI